MSQLRLCLQMAKVTLPALPLHRDPAGADFGLSFGRILNLELLYGVGMAPAHGYHGSWLCPPTAGKG